MTCLQNCGMWAQGSACMAYRLILVQQWSLMSRNLWQAPLTTLWPAGNGVPEPGPSTFGGTQGLVGCPFARVYIVILLSFRKARSKNVVTFLFCFFNLTCTLPSPFSVMTINLFIQVIIIWYLSMSHFKTLFIYAYAVRGQFFSPISFISCWTVSPFCLYQVPYLQIE